MRSCVFGCAQCFALHAANALAFCLPASLPSRPPLLTYSLANSSAPSLQGNQCCEEPQYRLAVLAALPGLTVLDLHQVRLRLR